MRRAFRNGKWVDLDAMGEQASPLEQSQKNIQNNATRILAAGGSVPDAQSDTHPALKVLSYMDRPREAIWNAVQDAYTGENSFGQGFMDGLTGKEHVAGTDLMHYLFGDAQTKAGKAAQGIGGFAAEMLLDPLNLIPTTGLGKFAKGLTTRAGGTIGMDALKSKVGAEFMSQIDKKADDVYDKVIRTNLDRGADPIERGWNKKNLRVMAMKSAMDDGDFREAYKAITGADYTVAGDIRKLTGSQAEGIFKYGKDLHVERKVNDPAELERLQASASLGQDKKGLTVGLGNAKKTLISGTAMHDAGAATYSAIHNTLDKGARARNGIISPVAKLILGAEKGTRKIFDNAYKLGIDPQEYQVLKNMKRLSRAEQGVAEYAARQKYDAFKKAAKATGIDQKELEQAAIRYAEGDIDRGYVVATMGDEAANLMDDVRREWLVQAYKKVGAGKMRQGSIKEAYIPHKQAIGVSGKLARAFTNDKLGVGSATLRERTHGETIDEFEGYLRDRLSKDAEIDDYDIPDNLAERNFLNLYLMSELETGSVLAEARAADAFKGVFGERLGNAIGEAAKNDDVEGFFRDVIGQGKTIVISKQLLKAVRIVGGGDEALRSVEDLAKARQEIVDMLGEEGLADIQGIMHGAQALSQTELDSIKGLLERTREDNPFIQLNKEDYLAVRRVIQDGYIVPTAMYDTFVNTSKKQANESFKALTDVIDGIHSFWKGTVAGLRPGFHMGNYMGSSWQNYVDHGLRVLVDPHIQYLAKAAAYRLPGWEAQVVKNADGTPMIIDGAAVTLGRVAKEMAARHAVSSMLTDTGEDVLKSVNAQNGNVVRKGLDKAMQVGHKVGNTVEWDVRTANYIAHLQKGLSWDDAAMATNRVHFDYGDLTDAEMKVFRRLAPFYTWSRKNIPLALEEIINQPRIGTVPERFTSNMNEAMGQDQQYMPSWAKNNMLIPNVAGMLGGDNAMLNAKLPLADLTRLHVSPDAIAKEGLGMLSPLYKMPMEIGQNSKILNGAPIVSPEMTGIEKVKAWAAYAASNMGIVNDISRAGVGMVAGQENDAPGALERRGSGLNLVPWDNLGYNYNEGAGELNASKSYERQLGNVMKTLRNQGIAVPEMSDLTQRTPLQKKYDRHMEYITHNAYQAPLSPQLQLLIKQAQARTGEAMQNYY